MKKITNICLNLIILISCALLLSSCQKKEEVEKVKIEILQAYGSLEEAAMRKIYKDFEKMHPDIEINLISLTSTKRVVEKVRDMLAVGRLPDIIYIGDSEGDNLYQFMRNKNLLLDLKEELELENFLGKEFIPYILEDSDDGIYSINDILKVRGYWYNKKIFALAGVEVPRSFEDFYTVCYKINKWAKEEKLDTKALEFSEEAMADFYYVLSKEKDSKEALASLDKLIKDCKITEVEAIYRSNLLSFNVGHSSMYISDLSKEDKISKNMDYGFAPLPSFSGNIYSQISASKGYMLSNSGKKKEEKASILFLKYMLSTQVAAKLFYEAKQIPNNKNFSSLIDTRYQEFVNLEKSGKHIGVANIDYNRDKYNYFMKNSANLFFGDIKLDNFADEIE